MSYKQCKTSVPEKCSKNACLKPGMGGHKGAFINVMLNPKTCRVACGKVIKRSSIDEFQFYKDLNDLMKLPDFKPLRPMIPKVFLKQTCSQNQNDYFVIENLAKGNSKLLDFKIGYKSAFKFKSGFFKSQRHSVLDKFFSTSRKFGFRLEGATEIDKILDADRDYRYYENKLKMPFRKKKLGLYTRHPFIIFENFFESRAEAEKILRKLKRFEKNFLIPNQKNAEAGVLSIGFIGASLLLSNGPDGDRDVDVKLIDFAKPVILDHLQSEETKRSYNKAITNFSLGLSNFIFYLDTWVKIN